MRIWYGNTELTANYKAIDVQRPIPSMEVETVDIPGADYARVRGARLRQEPITLGLLAKDKTWDERREVVRDIAGLLDSREPRQLRFSDDGGLYYMAQPSGGREPEQYLDCVLVRVEFLAADMVMRGETKTVSVPSGGSATFTVNGTRPALFGFTASATRNGSSLLWGLRIDNGDYFHIDTGSNASRNVVADFEKQTCKVSGATALPTLDSDWFEVSPGQHTVRMDNGTGTATLTYTERWV